MMHDVHDDGALLTLRELLASAAAEGAGGSGWSVTRHDINVGYKMSSTIAAMSTMLIRKSEKRSKVKVRAIILYLMCAARYRLPM